MSIITALLSIYKEKKKTKVDEVSIQLKPENWFLLDRSDEKASRDGEGAEEGGGGGGVPPYSVYVHRSMIYLAHDCCSSTLA